MREVLVFAAGWLLGNAGMWWLLTQARPRRETPPEPEGVVDYVCASGEHEDCPAYDCACWCHLPERDEWEWDDATLAALHDDTDLPGPADHALNGEQARRAGESARTDLPGPAANRGSGPREPVHVGADGRAGEYHEYEEPPSPAPADELPDWLDDPRLIIWDAKQQAARCWEIVHVEFPRLRAELGLVAA